MTQYPAWRCADDAPSRRPGIRKYEQRVRMCNRNLSITMPQALGSMCYRGHPWPRTVQFQPRVAHSNATDQNRLLLDKLQAAGIDMSTGGAIADRPGMQSRRPVTSMSCGMNRRVRVVPLKLEDEAEFVSAALASRELHGPWVSPPTTGEAFREKVKRMQASANAAYCVWRSDSDALVGCVEITQIVRGPFRSACLGYYAFAAHVRQGLMAEGLRQVVRLAFTRLKLHRLEANIQPENRASIALVRSCGFHREGFSPRYLKIRGRWRDHERWAILAS